jgi:flagellar biosynthesis protein FliR
MFSELLFGLGAGLAVAFLSEALVFGMQVFALQAGFSYASAVNPASEADSSVLEVIAQLASGMLFFLCGGDRLVLAAFARSLEVWPPGAAGVPAHAAARIISLGASMMELGLRLALPVAALLLLADVTLALLGRFHAQLQLLTLAFPVKTLGALAILAALSPLVPVLYRSGLGWAGSALGALLR